MGHHRFVDNSTKLPNNKLYSGSFTVLTCGLSLSIGLAGSHYILGRGKVIYCTGKVKLKYVYLSNGEIIKINRIFIFRKGNYTDN